MIEFKEHQNKQQNYQGRRPTMTNPPIQIILAHEKTLGKIVVELETFLEYDIDMTTRIQGLTIQFAEYVRPEKPQTKRYIHGINLQRTTPRRRQLPRQ